MIKRILLSLALCSSVFLTDTTETEAREAPTGCANPPCFGVLPPEEVPEGLSDEELRPAILRILNYLLSFLGIIAVTAIIYYGFLLVVSAGNDEQVSTAKRGIVWTLLGILLILLSWVITQFVFDIFADDQTASSSSSSSLIAGLLIETTQAATAPDPCPDSSCTNVIDHNKLDPGLTPGGLRETILQIVNYFLSFTGIIAVTGVIYCGFLLITSLGNEEQIATAKRGIIWIVLGILVILLSWTFVNFIFGATGAHAKDSVRDAAEIELRERFTLLMDEMEITEDLVSSENARRYADRFDEMYEDLPTTATGKALRKVFRSNTRELLNAQVEQHFNNLIEDSRAYELALAPEEQKRLRAETKRAKSGIDDKLSDLRKSIDDLQRMRARIDATPSRANIPAIIQFSAFKSSDPTAITIPSDNFNWSYIDHNGEEQELGTGPQITQTFLEPGSYVIRLEVHTNSNQDILPGIATVTVRVLPKRTTADFAVNDLPVKEFINIALQDAKKGIAFDPALSVATEGTSIEEYRWFFGGDDDKFVVKTRPDTELFSFDKTGRYKVRLVVIDSMGTESKKEIDVIVEPSLAVIRVRGTASPVAGERVEFDGSKSSLEGDGRVNYVWRISNSSGVVIFEEIGSPQVLYQFEIPGKYDIELDIGGNIRTKKSIVVQSRPPIVDFTFRPDSEGNPAMINFNASKSRDPEGNPLRFSWDFDGDGNLDVRNSENPKASYTYPKSSFYDVRLVVTDEGGQTSTLEKNLTIDSTLNAEFTVNPPVSQKGQEITLSPETKSGVRYTWQIDEEEPIITDEPILSHTFRASGKKNITLTVENESESSTFTKVVTVGDGKTPVAILQVVNVNAEEPVFTSACGPDKRAIEVSRSDIIELTAGDSVNRSGNKNGLRYSWEFYDGSLEQGSTIKKQYAELSGSGNCERITLSVLESQSGISATGVDLYVKVVNIPPVATKLIATPERRPCKTPCPVKVTLEGAADSDGRIETYRWWAYREGDSEKYGTSITKEPRTTITLPTLGQPNKENTFFFAAELIDNDGAVVRSDDLVVTTPKVSVRNADNPEPTISFFQNRSSVFAGDSITFTAQVDDPLKEALSSHEYAWDFDGDRQFDDTTSGTTVTHTYNEPGEYTVRLRVTVRGMELSKERKVIVAERKDPPYADFILEPSGLKINYDGRTSGFDPEIEGNQLSYRWDFDTETDSDGNGITDDDTDSTEARGEHYYYQPGEYSVQLQVTNSAGKTDGMEQTVVVRKSGGGLESRKKTIRNAKVTGNIPMAHLDIVLRYAPENQAEPAELYISAIDADGSLIDAPLKINIDDGVELLYADDEVTNGLGSATLLFKNPTESVSIGIEVSSSLGQLVETLSVSFP
jgi:PKD repeat protein/type IV secretory pathway VirB2 component (pilin)